MTLNPFKFSYPGWARVILWSLLTLSHIATTAVAAVVLWTTPVQIAAMVSGGVVLAIVCIASTDGYSDAAHALKIWKIMLPAHWVLVSLLFGVVNFTLKSWAILGVGLTLVLLIASVAAGYFETRRKTIEEVTEKFS